MDRAFSLLPSDPYSSGIEWLSLLLHLEFSDFSWSAVSGDSFKKFAINFVLYPFTDRILESSSTRVID